MALSQFPRVRLAHLPTPEMQETLRLLAGLIGLHRQGRFDGTRAVVFIHTGGLPIRFAYPSLFPPGLAPGI
jgi:1-aminocyclopropane-1-carboxylate deaminase/D-cysteine desulfhydrase-like pyridoxal-dependent ACC family enzyme